MEKFKKEVFISQTLYIACDHAGLELKNFLKTSHPHISWEDMGTDKQERVDYPGFADKLCRSLKSKDHKGILICGSGQGMAIRANKYPYIRAALCWNEEITTLCRQHNNANVLCMGSRFVEKQMALKLLKIFLETDFEGGRHIKRVEGLSQDIK